MNYHPTLYTTKEIIDKIFEILIYYIIFNKLWLVHIITQHCAVCTTHTPHWRKAKNSNPKIQGDKSIPLPLPNRCKELFRKIFETLMCYIIFNNLRLIHFISQHCAVCSVHNTPHCRKVASISVPR